MANFVFKLDLEENKYYFGYSRADGQDIEVHLHGHGCGWTRRYRPLRYEMISGNEHDVIHWVLTFMRHYGFNNVRGGYWEQVEPYKNPPPVLGRFIKGKTKYNKCSHCSAYGHSITKCTVKYDGCGDVIM